MDFRIKVAAQLDAKDFTAQLNALTKNTTKIPVKLDIQNADLKSFANDIKSIAKSIKVNVDSTGVTNARGEMTKLSAAAKQIQNFKVKLNTQGVAADLSKIDSQIKKLGTQSVDASKINSLTSSYTKLQSIATELSNKKILNESDISRYTTQFKTLQNQIKVVQNELSGMTTATDRIKLTSQMEAWLNKNTKATKTARAEIEQYIAAVNSAGANLTRGEFNDISKNFQKVNAEMAASGNLGKSWLGELGRSMKQIGQFAGVYNLIRNVAFRVPGEMVRAVKDVNAAQIELTKVSDAPTSQLTAYWDQAAESAKKYGATISDVISSTADWSRLGYNLDDSKILSDMTTLYQKVGDNMTQESASQSLVSTLQGFQLSADQAEHIVNSFNEVGNNFAIGSDGIGEALQRSSASLSAAGNTLEESIGLVTAANEVVQDPATVGTAYKTISMRIRGATSELEEAGLETDGMVESTAKLQEEILALSGIDIMQDKDTFKSTFSILDELSTKWQNLTDIQQANDTCLYVQKCA